MARYLALATVLSCGAWALGAGEKPGPNPVLQAPPTRLADLAREYQNPSAPYRIQYLLRTNDEVTPEQLGWQIRSIRETGGGGVFSYCEHLQGGSPDKFLSDWWWKVVDLTAKAAAKEGLLYWAYDEEDWPSGTAGGKLLKEHPDWTWKFLRPLEKQFAGPTQAEIELPDEPFVAAAAFRLDGKTLRFSSLIDLSERVQGRTLRWDVPAGEWTIAVYTAGTGIVWNASPYPDLMSHQAGAGYVDMVYAADDRRVSEIAGARLIGFFTDEPSFSVANYPAGKLFPWVPSMPYSPDLPEAFRRQHGVDWRKHVPLLYHDADPESLRFRCRHWQTCSRLYVENYFGQIFDFCEARGQASSGHVHIEESLMAHLTLQGGNLPAIYRRMHVPGIDWIHPFENALPANVPKMASSAAHLTGRPRTWCESFAASGLGLTFEQMRRMVNWEHVNGINMQVPICYKYSLRGANRAQFYCPGISCQQPYWDHFKAFADYEARLCLLASGGGHVAQVVLAYPAADLWSHCWEHDLLSQRSAAFNQIGEALRESGYDYDIFDDEVIGTARSGQGEMAIGPERYRTLILPQADTVNRATLFQAVQLARAGGLVIFQGGLPRHSIEHGSDDPAIATLVHGLLGEDCFEKAQEASGFWRQHRGGGRAGFAPSVQTLIPMLIEALRPDVAAEPGSEGLCALHRRLEDGDLYLLLNHRSQARTVHFGLSAKGTPQRWDPVSGEVTTLDGIEALPEGTRISLHMEADEIVPIVFPTASGGSAAKPRPSRVLKEIPVAGPFRFRVEQTISRPEVAWNFTQVADGWKQATSGGLFVPGSQPAELPAEMPAGDWSKHGLAGFSGLGHYETRIELPALEAGTRAVLDLGRVGQSAEVFVNGRSAGVVCLAPLQVDISEALKPGDNQLRISVANTLANHFWQFDEARKAPINATGVKEEDTVSGLLGPVTLRIHARWANDE